MASDDDRFLRIRAQYSIRSYLDQIGTRVDQHGVFRCVNPNGHDRNPSAKINPQNPELWQCFGCGERGDVVDLRALAEGCTIGEAASRFDGGVKPPPGSSPPPPRPKFVPRIVRGDYGPIPDDAPKPEKDHLEIWRNSKERPDEWTAKKERIAHLYPYRDRQGVLQAYVIRQEWLSKVDNQPMKRIIPVRWNLVAKRFDMVGFTGKEDRPLYNADQIALRRDAEILMVEGEKAANIAQALFPAMVVTTWIGGTGQVEHTDYDQLAGRHVTLWPDNDKKGQQAMAHIASAANAATLLMVPIDPSWQPKWDVADVAETAPGAALDALQKRSRYKPDVSPSGVGLWDCVSDGGWLPDDVRPVLGHNGTVKPDHPYNAELVLSHHPAFTGLSWDVLRNRIVWGGTTLDSDNSLLFMTGLLNQRAGLIIANGHDRIVETVARKRPVNPLAETIRATVWDSVRRVDALWTYFGLGFASEWHIAACKRWFLGLVNRILNPGAQSDLMLILEGPQGVGKSSALRMIGEPFGFPGFASITGFGSANAMNSADMALLSGKVLVEMDEMSAHRRADQDFFKGMLTRTEDRYRSPYGKHFLDYPRTATFAGSTNRKEPYFTDASGGRRFAPVIVSAQIDLAGLQDDRDQLYAEAAVMLERGEQPYLTEAEEDLQTEEILARTAVSAIKDQVENALEEFTKDVITPGELDVLLGTGTLPLHERDRLKPRIDQAMAELGWIFSKHTRLTADRDGPRRKGWTRGERKRGRPPKAKLVPPRTRL